MSIDVSISFKSEKIENEWKRIPFNKRRIKSLVLYAAYLIKETFGIDSVITEIFRDPSQQMSRFNAGLTPVKSNSPHEDWRAIDLRLKNLDTKQRQQVDSIVNEINANYIRTDGLITAIAHGVGDNFHLHLQIQKP